MCSESRDLQLQSGGSEPPTREIEKSISHVGGYVPPDTDLEGIVGCCEQTSKS